MATSIPYTRQKAKDILGVEFDAYVVDLPNDQQLQLDADLIDMLDINLGERVIQREIDNVLR